MRTPQPRKGEPRCVKSGILEPSAGRARSLREVSKVRERPCEYAPQVRTDEERKRRFPETAERRVEVFDPRQQRATCDRFEDERTCPGELPAMQDIHAEPGSQAVTSITSRTSGRPNNSLVTCSTAPTPSL